MFVNEKDMCNCLFLQFGSDKVVTARKRNGYRPGLRFENTFYDPYSLADRKRLLLVYVRSENCIRALRI